MVVSNKIRYIGYPYCGLIVHTHTVIIIVIIIIVIIIFIIIILIIIIITVSGLYAVKSLKFPMKFVMYTTFLNAYKHMRQLTQHRHSSVNP